MGRLYERGLRLYSSHSPCFHTNTRRIASPHTPNTQSVNSKLRSHIYTHRSWLTGGGVWVWAWTWREWEREREREADWVRCRFFSSTEKMEVWTRTALVQGHTYPWWVDHPNWDTLTFHGSTVPGHPDCDWDINIWAFQSVQKHHVVRSAPGPTQTFTASPLHSFQAAPLFCRHPSVSGIPYFRTESSGNYV